MVNRRDGVRGKTAARVEAALAKLGDRPDAAATRLARTLSFRFAFILPIGANTFMTNLGEQVRRAADWLATQRAFVDVLHVDVFDPDALASALGSLPPSYHGVATIALDHPKVRAAIDELANRGVPVVTLVSDAPSSRRLHYVGIDNPAAGRTAATLMGRFLRSRRGTIGVIAGSLVLRDHAERQFGFLQILSSEYPDLPQRCLPWKAVTTTNAPAQLRRPCSLASPTSSASTASAPATGASPPPWKSRAAPAKSSGSPTN